KEQGWSPYEAKDFLFKKGLNTGFYNRVFEQEWSASSPMEEFGGGVIQNNISYYVEGTEEVANILKLKVNVNDDARSLQAREKLEEIAQALSISSLNKPLSKKMKMAISQCEPYSEILLDKKISLVVEKWPNHTFNGYDIKFIISITQPAAAIKQTYRRVRR
ncbi:hypothetical protein EAY46_28005, partial [Vibrio anguillarum]|nr:hypothetical protein [Vibrio anguillarum]